MSGLTVSPATAADLPTAAGIQERAFSDTVLYALMNPNGPSDEARARTLERLQWVFENESSARFLKVTDDATGDIIAFAKWREFLEPRTAEELDQEGAGAPPRSTNAQPGIVEEFFVLLGRWRREVMGGDPYYHLHLLITDPSHQRRGAGSMLMQWGVSRADAAGLPAYLESSAKGYELYKRYGFEERGLAAVNLAPYGGKGDYSNRVMLRPARSKGNSEQENVGADGK